MGHMTDDFRDLFEQRPSYPDRCQAIGHQGRQCTHEAAFVVSWNGGEYTRLVCATDLASIVKAVTGHVGSVVVEAIRR